MHEDGQTMLEYFRTTPPRVEVGLGVGRALALGYVALCVAVLIVMGTVMALQV